MAPLTACHVTTTSSADSPLVHDEAGRRRVVEIDDAFGRKSVVSLITDGMMQNVCEPRNRVNFELCCRRSCIRWVVRASTRFCDIPKEAVASSVVTASFGLTSSCS